MIKLRPPWPTAPAEVQPLSVAAVVATAVVQLSSWDAPTASVAHSPACGASLDLAFIAACITSWCALSASMYLGAEVGAPSAVLARHQRVPALPTPRGN